ncbi:hypothetical protein HNQ57_001366 [Zhongshania antarctica]|uniref:Uncharacterized protein n=1 Tax=Zhongshania antarctica TaxID=641702 RepID=A0A840R3E7_9GAMM|nr:hypothetical protein [Zhongshania antarctica]
MPPDWRHGGEFGIALDCKVFRYNQKYFCMLYRFFIDYFLNMIIF